MNYKKKTILFGAGAAFCACSIFLILFGEMAAIILALIIICVTLIRLAVCTANQKH